MKLVTFRAADGSTHAGVIRDERIFVLNYPTLLELLHDADGLTQARQAFLHGSEKVCMLNEVVLCSPIPEPPAIRDFYAFEQHVKTARANRGLDMIPEWYEIPIFYFSNNSEVYGEGQEVPYPAGSRAVDFELEIACVIGREGKNIEVEAAANYIAGYTIMNDWSARDFQLQEMKLNLGPGKGKDFATSLGPWLVTPDELAVYRHGQGATMSADKPQSDPSSERYDMTMLARINGKEVSRGNFNQIYYSFPQMIAWASRNARLRPGDILGSGTVGTGCILELGTKVHRWLQREDVVELEVEGIGVLRNRIV
ncbi:MAG: fumarylacetoacetate hydrolase family protein [Ktedonobacteraceae bacterium]|nr:fumarylacetoacetate hydrolase family protein [Ktedonobacteraceae bacterium]